MKKKICIIGGCGHVGIPLGLAFASKNFDVTLVDVNPQAVENINRVHLPFKEDGAEELLAPQPARSSATAGMINFGILIGIFPSAFGRGTSDGRRVAGLMSRAPLVIGFSPASVSRSTPCRRPS